MSEYTVTLSEAEEKALLTEMVSINEWLNNLVHARASRAMCRVVESTTDKRAKAISASQREEIVKKASVRTAEEKGRELELSATADRDRAEE